MAGDLLKQSWSAYTSGNYPQAISAADRFIAAYADSQEAGEAHYLRALAEIQLGQQEPAGQDLRRAIELSRRADLIGRANLALGQLAQKKGDDAAAEPLYRSAVASLPANSPPADEALAHLGEVLQRLGQWEQADLQFDRLTFLFPKSSWAGFARQSIRARAWTVLVGTFTQRRHADELAEQLRQAGFAPEVVSELNKEVILAVQTGRFNTYKEAAETLPALRAMVPSAIVTTAR